MLRGAPAVVAAVDRYVIADSSEAATYHAPEVAEALKLLAHDSGVVFKAPNYDANALRNACGSDGRKLGLGSSAAIVVASLGACIAAREPTLAAHPERLRERVYPFALRGHQLAQGGGSGVDVAAATFGGILCAQRPKLESELEVVQASLPASLKIEVWAMPESALTSEFVKRFNEFEKRSPEQFSMILSEAKAGAEQAAQIACMAIDETPSAKEPIDHGLQFIAALRAQYRSFCQLGLLADMPIVLPAVERLNLCLAEDALFMPSGAGGGDITLYFGTQPSPPHFRKMATNLHLEHIPLELAAPGLTLLPSN